MQQVGLRTCVSLCRKLAVVVCFQQPFASAQTKRTKESLGSGGRVVVMVVVVWLSDGCQVRN